MEAKRRKRSTTASRAPARLTPEERELMYVALASLEAAEVRTAKGTAVLGKRATLEDRLWELSRIADALEERFRVMEERTRL